MIHGCISNVLCAGCSGDSALFIMHISSIHTPLSSAVGWGKESNICLHRNNLLFLNSLHSPITFLKQKKQENNIAKQARVAVHPISAVRSGIMSKQDAEDTNSHGSMERDLLVVGPGVLGRLVAEKWLQESPSCHVFGLTRTTNHHEELHSLGIKTIIRGSELRKRFPFVIFCAPPSGNEDYSSEIRAAIMQWSGEGSFLFTSSSAVYDCYDNGLCGEECPTVPMGRSARTDTLLMAEAEALKGGGNVIRLAGLYKLDRGAHMYYLKKGSVDAHPEHIINLIHYEDAASLCKIILEKRYQGRVFMGCDNCPLSREKMMEYVTKSGKFKENFQGFTGLTGPLGKQMDNSKTRNKIGWVPKYRNFSEFLGVTS
ncbi:uncharacterized protein LOC131067013 isoform X1 [Cryptomeria japonica]|uniref:uncharacterized protein LOC131067013 isoform X1 n=1 Tax=Cryptomeria japonica TaxID=3369 RepID=UPI0027DA6FC6|nr:uncharacterized protein LOC131067013 isoform X1 [Cryptomeria japonica]